MHAKFQNNMVIFAKPNTIKLSGGHLGSMISAKHDL
jgi:hypothetical protein